MIDESYVRTVRLLLDVMPLIFETDIFAIKGGTAINLFVQNAPRLSVDIDLVYLDAFKERGEALQEIADELQAIKRRMEARGHTVEAIGTGSEPDSKLMVMASQNLRLKIEVNTSFRGTVLPLPGRQTVSTAVADRFGVAPSAPILARDEIYASKMVAALDRQHPRDLFDVWMYYQEYELTDTLMDCFLVYLAGHNRPPHEVLAGNDKDISETYKKHFVGMTEAEPPALEVLLEARARLRVDILSKLTDRHRAFLIGLVKLKPDWNLLTQSTVQHFPAVRWKIHNLENLRNTNPEKFAEQVEAVKMLLYPTQLGAQESYPLLKSTQRAPTSDNRLD